MKELLAPRHRRAFDRLLASAGGPMLLAFDYDGVLAPVIPDPAGASMTRRTRGLLRALAARAPVAVISGRSYAKLHRVAGGVAPFLVGNHGHEFLRATPASAEVRAAVRRWERELMDAVAATADAGSIHLERKRSTFAVHWSQARDRARAGRAVLRAARALQGVRLVPGKNVLNVLPAAFPTKGDAVRRLLSEVGCSRALFVGDDVTDEDVFALPRRLVVGVHVGAGPSRAAWRIADRDGVDELLEKLVALARSRSPFDSAASRLRSGRAEFLGRWPAPDPDATARRAGTRGRR